LKFTDLMSDDLFMLFSEQAIVDCGITNDLEMFPGVDSQPVPNPCLTDAEKGKHFTSIWCFTEIDGISNAVKLRFDIWPCRPK